MSKEEIKNANPSEEKEKVVTKYDLKVQRRKEEKEKEERAKRISTGVTIAVLIALVCLVLSFPIRTYITLNKTFITVGNEKVTRVEFDYCYYTVVNNYVNSYSSYLSMFGLDVTKDLSTQMYSNTMSWKDYFEEMTVNNLRQSKAMKADAAAKGFTCDVSAEYENIVKQLKNSAKEEGTSIGKYIQQLFGSYATLDRIKPYIEEAIFVNEYNEKLAKDMTPSAEEIQAKYEEDPDSYDSVDYRILTFTAVLPTEPTELADEGVELKGEEEYTPSDAEVEKAMADAKAEADAALGSVKLNGELISNVLRSSTNSVLRDWLFDSETKEGDKTVLEDTTNNRYYCVALMKRYRDETPTANVRVMVTNTEEEALDIYGTWNSNGASEDCFIELCNGKYSEYSVADDGLVEGMSKTEDLYEELQDWIFAEDRKPGDCGVVTVEETASFVVYYVGEGDPVWYNTIKNNEVNTAVNEYVDQLTETCEVQDPDKNLNYLEIRAQEEAAAAASEAASEALEASEAAENTEGGVEIPVEESSPAE